MNARRPDTCEYVRHHEPIPAENWDGGVIQRTILAESDWVGSVRTASMPVHRAGFFYVYDWETSELNSAEKYGCEGSWARHYNWHRYYDPTLGRYISADAIGQAGGMNVYNYALNNPINLSDPMGLLPPGGLRATIAAAGGSRPLIDASQAPAAVVDFGSNYLDMREANTVGADKYFHCKANCEASQRGPVGEDTGELLSDARESFDANVKGDPPAACQADQAANESGRLAGG